MNVVRAGIDEERDLGVGHDVAPVGGGAREAVAVRDVARLGLGAIA